jgi:hypothetical protein
MTDHTSKLETRVEIQTRVSAPHGRSQADREDSIAFLLVQLKKDMAVSRRFREDTISRLKNLKGIENVLGSKSLIRDLNQDLEAMHLLETGCSTILDLTKNKDVTIAAEKRFSVAEAEQTFFEKTEKFALEKAMNPNTKMSMPSKFPSSTDFKEEFDEMVVRRKQIFPDVFKTPTKHKKTLAKMITPQSTKTIPAKRRSKRKQKQNSSPSILPIGPASFTTTEGVKHVLPEPGKNRIMYTLREMILHLEPFHGKGMKKIVTDLRKQGRVQFSPATFVRWMRQRQQEGIGDDGDDTIGNGGKEVYLKNPRVQLIFL